MAANQRECWETMLREFGRIGLPIRQRIPPAGATLPDVRPEASVARGAPNDGVLAAIYIAACLGLRSTD